MSRVVEKLGLVLLAGLLLGAGGGGRGGRSDFWGTLARPGHERFAAALDRGRAQFERATRTRDRARWRLLLEGALAAFREAVQAVPGDAHGHYWEGRALYELGRMREAVARLEQVRRLDRAFPEEYTICFSLGIAYSKLGRFAEAVLEYDRAERILAAEHTRSSTARNSRATLHGNAAEALMALGRLDEAIQRYREALALQPAYVLGWWGLGVALDRDEQVSKANAAVRRALSQDAQLQQLSGPGVFFIPEGDVHYYHGVGYLALGKNDEAARAFAKFAAELPASPWVARAREHLALLGRRSAAPAARRRLAPSPAGGAEPSDATTQDRGAIRYRMRSRVRALRACYLQERRADKDLAGLLRVSFVVSTAGKPSQVTLLGSTLGRPALHACVLDVIRKTPFDRLSGGRPLTVTYPIDFKPR